MIKKKVYCEKTETGYIIHIKYSLFGIPVYVKEKIINKGTDILDYEGL